MSSTQQQLHRPDAYQNTEEYGPADTAHRADATQGPAAASQSRGLGGGTDVMGEPVNPTSSQTYDQGYAGDAVKNGGSYPTTSVNPTSSQMYEQGYDGDAMKNGISYPTSGGSANPSFSQTYEQGYAGDAMKNGGSYPATSGGSYGYAPSNVGSHTPAGASTSPYSTTGLPPSQMPGNSTAATAAAHQSANANATQNLPSPSPYVHTSSIPGGTGKTPMDSIMQVFNKWSKKAEDMTGNVWNHLKTGPNVADTALGRIAIGTKAMAEGGLDNVFRQTFEVLPEEHLLKSFACYLSTSTGPVAGTLYLSTHKLAFCSDRPLAIPGSSPKAAKQTSPTRRSKHSATTNTESSAQQQQQWCYYKVMVPISQLQAVNPIENTQKKPSERYVQVKTVDGHEFWFLGFVNYDKGVKNLQETLGARNSNTSSTMNSGNMNSTPSYNRDSMDSATSNPSYNTNTTASTPSYERDPTQTTTTPSYNTNTTPYTTTNTTPPPSYDSATASTTMNAPHNVVN